MLMMCSCCRANNERSSGNDHEENGGAVFDSPGNVSRPRRRYLSSAIEKHAAKPNLENAVRWPAILDNSKGRLSKQIVRRQLEDMSSLEKKGKHRHIELGQHELDAWYSGQIGSASYATHAPTSIPASTIPTDFPSSSIMPSQTPTANPTFLCSCAPSAFTWTLNFMLTCPPEDIHVGSGTGIIRSNCQISSRDANVTDMTPALIHTFQILELDAGLETVNAESRKDLNLTDGEELSYTSIVATELDVVPGGLIVRLVGDNRLGEEVELKWIVQYSNNCSEFPFSPGNSLGWTVFVSICN